MKQSAIILTASLLAMTPAFAQPVTVSQVLELKQRAGSAAFAGRAEWNALTFYLQGVIEGAASYQETLIKNGQSPLFCPPKGKSYSIEGMFGYLEKAAPADRNRTAIAVIIEGYAKQYPCEH